MTHIETYNLLHLKITRRYQNRFCDHKYDHTFLYYKNTCTNVLQSHTPILK